MRNIILGYCPELIKALGEAGLMPEYCTRMVIDITATKKVKVYYEVLGDKRLLGVDFKLFNEKDKTKKSSWVSWFRKLYKRK